MPKFLKTSDMFRSPYDHPQGVCQSLLKLHYVHCEHQRKKNENNLNISFTPQLEPEITQEYKSSCNYMYNVALCFCISRVDWKFTDKNRKNLFKYTNHILVQIVVISSTFLQSEITTYNICLRK